MLNFYGEINMNKCDWKAIFLMISIVVTLPYGTILIPQFIKDFVYIIFMTIVFIMWGIVGILYLLRWIGFDTSKIIREYEKM